MDSPFKDGDPPKLTNDHRYQIGNTPLYLSIARVNNVPRISMILVATPSGAPIDPPVRVHMGTLKDDGAALCLIEFLDEMLAQVNKAIAHYRGDPVSPGTPTPEEQRNASQN